MGSLDTASQEAMQSFRSVWAQATTIPELEAYFFQGVSALGFKYVALCERVHLTRPPERAVAFSNLPEGWAAHYAERGYHLISGAFDAVQRGAAPFFWSDAQFLAGLSPEQLAVVHEARDFGMRDRFTWPLVAPGAPIAACSFVVDPDQKRGPSLYAAGGMMAMYAYARAREILSCANGNHLSARERQCLGFVAQGKSDWAIAQILHLSERTVHNTLERAKSRLGVSTRLQAVLYALDVGEIALDRRRPAKAGGLATEDRPIW